MFAMPGLRAFSLAAGSDSGAFLAMRTAFLSMAFRFCGEIVEAGKRQLDPFSE